jgi:lysophospholipase L1-like esterase
LVLGALALLGCAPSAEGPRAWPADRQAPFLYVALGDSTVEGVGASRPDRNYVSRLHARLREWYPAARVENLGVGGATSADVLKSQLGRAIALAPHLITLSVGPNDITRRVPVERYERTMIIILESLAGRTRAVVVVNLLPDLAVTRRFRGGPHEARVGRLTVEFNDVLRRVVPARGADLVDLYEPSRREVLRHPELLATDGYHPSDAGYARWAELMWEGIARRIGHGG